MIRGSTSRNLRRYRTFLRHSMRHKVAIFETKYLHSAPASAHPQTSNSGIQCASLATGKATNTTTKSTTVAQNPNLAIIMIRAYTKNSGNATARTQKAEPTQANDAHRKHSRKIRHSQKHPRLGNSPRQKTTTISIPRRSQPRPFATTTRNRHEQLSHQ